MQDAHILTWARIYRPDLARWLSRDPLRNAELLQGPNLYTYVGNDPINAIDPLGLAYIADRPLKNQSGALISPFIGKGYEGVHRQVFFEDYDKQTQDPKKYPSNLGLFDDDTVRPDDAKPDLMKKYQRKAGGFDDDLMRKAFENAEKKYDTDWKATDNCQDFVDKVVKEYNALKKVQKAAIKNRINH